MLGICYGMQLMALVEGGEVGAVQIREYGRSDLVVKSHEGLFAGTPDEQKAWTSHGDAVLSLPEGFEITAETPSVPIIAFEDGDQGRFGVQFHPEVRHTEYGMEILKNFLFEACGCRPEWTPVNIITDAVERIREQVGEARAICGLSGGVDSATAAMLVHRAIGDNLTCVFVDHGLLRHNEAEQVVEAFAQNSDVPLVHVDAGGAFPGQARRRHRPRGEAQDHRRGVHPHLRGRGRQARGRHIPGAGHALLRRNRERDPRRRQDKEPPQRGRPPRGHGPRPRRAFEEPLQGRGARRRGRARDAREARLEAAVPRDRGLRSGS